jgi:hypothetical protein
MASSREANTEQENTANTTEVAITPQAITAYRMMEARSDAERAEMDRRYSMIRFRPSHMYPCVLYHDGLRWACEYISGLETRREEEGIPLIAYGQFPEEAMQNFDALWIGAETASAQDDKEGLGDEDI